MYCPPEFRQKKSAEQMENSSPNLLFHLRLPNSKTNQPKFWQILSSPKNSFAKTSSALKPHALPEYLEGRTPKEKHPFLFQKKFHPRQIRNARSVFSFWVQTVRELSTLSPAFSSLFSVKNVKMASIQAINFNRPLSKVPVPL